MHRSLLALRLPAWIALPAVTAALLVAQPSRARATDPPPTPSGVRFVALGDSFSAGEGIPPYADVPGAGQGCHQSTRGYATLVGDGGYELPGAPEVALDNVACAGARVRNLVVVPQDARGEPHAVQADHVGPDADLVAATVGGNDLGFTSVLHHCATRFRCYAAAFVTLDSGRVLSLDEFLRVRLTLLEPELAALYRTLRARTQDQAAVVALDYPELFDDGFAVRLGCFEAGLFTRDERVYLNGMAREIRAVIARQAAAEGVWFADVVEEFKGHRVCDGGVGTQREWLTGVEVSGRTGGDASFHPDEQGAQAYARVLTRFLRDRAREGGPATAAGLPANPGAGSPARPPGDAAAGAAAEPATAGGAGLTPAEVAEVGAREFGTAGVASLALLRGEQTCLDRLAPGEQVVLSGDGFAPGSRVEVRLGAAGEEAPRRYAQALTADHQGEVTASLIVPRDLAPVAEPGDSQRWTALEVTLEGGAAGGAPRRLSDLAAVDSPSGWCTAHRGRAGDLAGLDGAAAAAAAAAGAPGLVSARERQP